MDELRVKEELTGGLFGLSLRNFESDFESGPVLFNRRDIALFQQSLRLRRSDVYLDLQSRKFLQEFDTRCPSREFIVVAVRDMPIYYKSISVHRRNIRPLNLLEVRNF
jgi:hypothetical protein